MNRLCAFSLRTLAAIAVCVIGLTAASVAAQRPPLAEVARKEAERRKAQEPADKVYTGKDLPASAHDRAVAAPADGDVAPVPAPAAPAPKTPVRDQAWWKARIVDARDELRRNEVLAEALQTRINALSRDFVSRDDPAQRARLGQERADALNERARLEQEIARGRKGLDDIEEEARTTGVPPGWLR